MCAVTTAAVLGVLSKYGSTGVRTRVSYRSLADGFSAGSASAAPAFLSPLLVFGFGGITNIRRSTSSNSWPLRSGFTGGFTGRLATIGQPLACN